MPASAVTGWCSPFPERQTEGSTQMGGEGANWIGEAPFSTRRHVFQNIGDGTYNHSGLLAIRAAIAADVNITYKILYNDAVAMTGGQGNDGPLSVPMIARQMRACGVRAHRRRFRRAGQICAGGELSCGHELPSPRRHHGGAERSDGGSRRLGPDLRPDLRGGEATPAQARRLSRSQPARVHQ